MRKPIYALLFATTLTAATIAVPVAGHASAGTGSAAAAAAPSGEQAASERAAKKRSWQTVVKLKKSKAQACVKPHDSNMGTGRRSSSG